MATPPKKTTKKPAVKKKVPTKKPVAKKAATKAKVTAKPAAAKAAPTKVSSTSHVPPQTPQPIKLVTASPSQGRQFQEYWDKFSEYAQENPAVTFVSLVAVVLGLILLFG